MGDRLKIPFVLRLKAGGVMTFIGTAPDQCVYWSMEALDPVPERGPWPPCGSLRYERTKTDKSSRATNVYMAPEHDPTIRFGMGYKFGTVKFGQKLGLIDKVTVKAVIE